MPGAVAGRADRKHHRHFDQNADDRCQRRARFRAEQRNSGRHGQLKEIRSADQRPRSGHGMLDFEPLHKAVSEARIKINLQGDRNRDQHHMEKSPGDVIRLKRKDQHERAEQRRDRDRREFRQQDAFKPCLPVAPHEHSRSSTPASSGTTINTSTEVSSTLKGTVSDDAPCTRNCTIGTNSTSMMRSFTDTCTSV